MRMTIFAAALALAGAAKAEEPGYLFDALRLPRFHNSWERLVKSVQPTPDWLLNFERDYDGAAGAMTVVQVGGKSYRLSFVCEPEDCDGHKFQVLFDADGQRALGALGGKDEPPAFYGGPNPAEQEALTKALNPPELKNEVAKPTDPKAADTKPDEPKSDDPKSADPKSDGLKTEAAKPAQPKSE